MNKNKLYLQQLLSALLFALVLGLIGWLSVRHDVHWDWTAGKRNTLTAATQQQLKSMDGPLKFIAFTYPGSDDRASIDFFVERYKRVKPDVEVEYIDPSAQPQKVRDYNIVSAGEVVLEYDGRHENLRGLSEQAITTALQRLTYTGESWVVFLEGHGERSTESQDPDAISAFAQVLKDKGLKVQSLNLIKTPQIPDNTSVLVIASPSSALLDGEIKLIQDYVSKGGNLLWLADPDHATGLQGVADELGLHWQNGYAVFPEAQALGLPNPGIYPALGYPPSPVTRGLDQVTLFPFVRSLSTMAPEGWVAQPLLTSSEAAWLETGALDGEVEFNEGKGDIAGPLTIGATMTRERPGSAETPKSDDPMAPPPPKPQQRVIAIGDADFLSNTYLGQLGNQQLGVNIIQWLAARDSQINVDIPKAPDVNLLLPDWAIAAIAGGFVVVLPLLLLGIGVGRWARRRRR
jgi:ABC-type uncharacterized transport system involved in gliding motility auxiliary subunit